MAAQAYSNILKPKTVKDFQRTSVRVMNMEKNSGGTGSILQSSKNGSVILTNKHVCRLIEQGGLVEQNGDYALISHYKKFTKHDLCLVKVKKNYGISLALAKDLGKQSDRVTVSGHPNLLPHIATKGHLSGEMIIQLITSVRRCTKSDLITNGNECMFFGGIPNVERFNSVVVSNLIKPGSSGSAVFNRSGEIVGVVFAGSGRDFSHGFIVPHLNVAFFLKTASFYTWVKTGTKVDAGNDIIDRVFNFEKCKQVRNSTEKKYLRIKEICSNLRDNVIWRK